MEEFPSIAKPIYTSEMKKGFCQAESLAALYGVDKRFLKLATSDYTSEPNEQYELHSYTTLTINSSLHGLRTITNEEQFKSALDLRDSGHLWSEIPSIIIVNSPYDLFEPTKDLYQGSLGFMSHLLCSMAHRKAIGKIKESIMVADLGMTDLDYSRHYRFNERNLFVWGPVTEHANSYEISKTIQFLFSLRLHTRIIRTATKDLGALLEKLHINPDAVSHYFNFGLIKGESAKKAEALDKPKVVRKKQATRKRIDVGV